MNVWTKLRDVVTSLPRIRLFRPMAIKIDWGRKNIVSIKGRFVGSLRIRGDNNHIELPDSATLSGHIVIRGSNVRIVIGEQCRIRGDIVVKGTDQTVTIGEGTTFNSVYILCIERSHVKIGRWCMFSRRIEVRTSDAHSLIERKTGKRVNPAASVTVGDHVWVGLGAILSKGTTIADDCVVGAMSFVNKSFSESGVVIAGAPARVVKTGITWNRERRRKFALAELDNWRQPPDDCDSD